MTLFQRAIEDHFIGAVTTSLPIFFEGDVNNLSDGDRYVTLQIFDLESKYAHAAGTNDEEHHGIAMLMVTGPRTTSFRDLEDDLTGLRQYLEKQKITGTNIRSKTARIERRTTETQNTAIAAIQLRGIL